MQISLDIALFKTILLGIKEKVVIDDYLSTTISQTFNIQLDPKGTRIPGFFFLEAVNTNVWFCWDYDSWLSSWEKHEATKAKAEARRQERFIKESKVKEYTDKKISTKLATAIVEGKLPAEFLELL